MVCGSVVEERESQRGVRAPARQAHTADLRHGPTEKRLRTPIDPFGPAAVRERPYTQYGLEAGLFQVAEGRSRILHRAPSPLAPSTSRALAR